MALLGHERYCDELVAQAGMLAGLLSGADLAVPVPTCPDWRLGDLVGHVGGNLRVIEAAVRTGQPVDDVSAPTGEAADVTGGTDRFTGEAGGFTAGGAISGAPGATGEAVTRSAHEAAAWLAESAAQCASVLRATGPDEQAYVWGFTARTDYLARRATHDLVVHRADTAITVGADFSVAPEVAVDAIDELLEMLGDPGVIGANPRMAELRGGPDSSIHLHGTDDSPDLFPEWLIELYSKGFSWRRSHTTASVTLRGPLSYLLLVCYRRMPPTDSRVEVLGDSALLDFWLDRASLT
ncbi:TIGR03083 family protein [Sinosporangium album]|uniref:TIGR03083 family protein n=1 Tax=Sinosporangium album TaxID=504805 RepID=A0A1G8H297_9ACTN|nr:maleylpyruvate isomerase family mycothiol-dependent enzyme [Sinosporangium album]SDI00768.1 TIGR03083 family protein [Sinosporangium album]